MKFVKAFILVIAVQFAHAQVNCITTGDQLGPYLSGALRTSQTTPWHQVYWIPRVLWS
jgi:hypothetical protein